MSSSYECIVIGGGIAGLQAAIQLGRYQHRILVIDSNNGRSSICKQYNNILGWPNGVSGQTLRELGRQQAERYHVHFREDTIVGVRMEHNEFVITGKDGGTYYAKTILLATGVTDRVPSIPNLNACLGVTIYVCPDCDGYEVINKRVLVLGAGETGANLALTLLYWTKQIIYVNHDGEELSTSLKQKLHESHIQYEKEPIREVLTDADSNLMGVTLHNGKKLYAERAFIGFGGNEVHTELAQQLGVTIAENKHIVVDTRTKETDAKNIWAAGDIVAHSEQLTIAMGDGCQAAVWIHKRLLEEYN